MNDIKVAKQLIKVAKLLMAAPEDDSQGLEEQDLKIADMIKTINSKKSALSSKGKKKCGAFGIDDPKLKQVTVEQLVQALHQIASEL